MPTKDSISADEWEAWPDDKLLTPAQVGFILSYSPEHAKVLIRRKTIQYVQQGDGMELRVRLADLKAYIHRHSGRYTPPSKKGKQ